MYKDEDTKLDILPGVHVCGRRLRAAFEVLPLCGPVVKAGPSDIHEVIPRGTEFLRATPPDLPDQGTKCRTRAHAVCAKHVSDVFMFHDHSRSIYPSPRFDNVCCIGCDLLLELLEQTLQVGNFHLRLLILLVPLLLLCLERRHR